MIEIKWVVIFYLIIAGLIFVLITQTINFKSEKIIMVLLATFLGILLALLWPVVLVRIMLKRLLFGGRGE